MATAQETSLTRPGETRRTMRSTTPACHGRSTARSISRAQPTTRRPYTSVRPSLRATARCPGHASRMASTWPWRRPRLVGILCWTRCRCFVMRWRPKQETTARPGAATARRRGANRTVIAGFTRGSMETSRTCSRRPHKARCGPSLGTRARTWPNGSTAHGRSGS